MEVWQIPESGGALGTRAGGARWQGSRSDGILEGGGGGDTRAQRMQGYQDAGVQRLRHAGVRGLRDKLAHENAGRREAGMRGRRGPGTRGRREAGMRERGGAGEGRRRLVARAPRLTEGSEAPAPAGCARDSRGEALKPLQPDGFGGEFMPRWPWDADRHREPGGRPAWPLLPWARSGGC